MSNSLGRPKSSSYWRVLSIRLQVTKDGEVPCLIFIFLRDREQANFKLFQA